MIILLLSRQRKTTMWKLERACLNEIESVGVEVTPRHPHKRAILSMFPVYRLCIDNWLGQIPLSNVLGNNK